MDERRNQLFQNVNLIVSIPTKMSDNVFIDSMKMTKLSTKSLKVT